MKGMLKSRLYTGGSKAVLRELDGLSSEGAGWRQGGSLASGHIAAGVKL